MKAKKSQKADLENKRNTFLLFGLVAALSVVLLAFEWNSSPTQAIDFGSMTSVDMEEEVVIVTWRDKVKPPPPPPMIVPEVINIVDDDVKLDDEFEMEPSEVTDDSVFDIAPITQTGDEEEIEEDQIFIFAEQQPEFPGGERALLNYINSHVKYPVIAQENGIQGRVFCKFVVDVDGSVTHVEILRSVDSSLDNEAKRVLSNLPKFKPGKQGGRPVKVFYNSSINFVLQ